MREGKQAVTFLKKSNQKTSANWAHVRFVAQVSVNKSFFASFFAKKEALTCLN
jgi:hypothetical protein